MTTNESNISSVKKSDISSAARKALIASNSDYFSLSEKEQELFRATKSELADKKSMCVLLDSILDIQCDLENVYEVWADIPYDKLTDLNWANLLTTGIGDNFIRLNGFLPTNTTLLDFETLYDYDYASYLSQQQSSMDDISDYNSHDYYAFKHPVWSRLLINDEFYYGSITSVANHMSEQINDIARDYIEQLIPTTMIDIDKKNEGDFLAALGLEQNANGLEEQLAELNERWFPYFLKLWLEISKTQSDLEPAVYEYKADCYFDNDPNRTFIFTNEKTLKKVRWKSFLSDCKPLIADYSIIEKQVDKMAKDVRVFLDKNYQDIMDNFDPKVVKLRKKRKIIMSANALDDIEKLMPSDEGTE